MNKKLMGILLIFVMMIGLTACTNSTERTSDESNTKSESTEEETTNNTKSSGKTLVVYYSATGTTKKVAELIAEKTSGDLFELVPVKPYTDEDLDWRNDDSRVSVEHNNEDDRNVELESTIVPNWDTYDTIYIGYPIWWAIAAWPVDNFVKENNFTGKKVIPFSTAVSSGIGESGELLKDMAGTGEWINGECFKGNITKEDVEKWIDSLN